MRTIQFPIGKKKEIAADYVTDDNNEEHSYLHKTDIEPSRSLLSDVGKKKCKL